MTRPIPRPLTGDDLLELAARAKATREVTADEAFQLGEGIEIMASYVLELEAEISRLKAAGTHARTIRGYNGVAHIGDPDEEPDTRVVDVPIAGGAR